MVRVRMVRAAALVAALVASLVVVFPLPASAAGVALFSQTFANNAVTGGVGAVVKPAPPSGTNTACLTATGNSATGVLVSCPTSTSGSPWVNDANGSGTMSLTPQQTTKVGGVFAATSVPTSQGLDVRFTMHQWGNTSSPADGIAFGLSAVDPTNPAAPPNIGPTGGSLGYAAFSSARGLANGYLGFGFDVYGNFSNTAYQGSGCPVSAYTRAGLTSAQVLVRGPGNGTVGYCGLNGTATSSSAAKVALRSTSRAASAIPVQIVVNPFATTFTTTNGIAVAAQSYLLRFTPVGAATPTTLTGALPVMAASLVTSSTWLDSNGVPKQLAFGWVGSTGSLVDNHEISNVTVTSLNTVPQLTASQVAYTPASSLVAGNTVTYTATAGVAAGADDPGPISVTETVPAGLKPLGASGSGWSCAVPSGQSITCTYSNGPFTAGSSLPPVTVTAVATTTVTAATVQSASVVTASSDTSLAGYSNTSSAGTSPSTPTVTAVTPSLGSTAGGGLVVLSGTNLADVTSVQIGTSAQLSAGAGSTLVKCPGVAAPGCFTVSNGSIVISSMPAHTAAPVTVRVVSYANSATGSYTYAAIPAAPVVTATAGITAATATWTAPASGGSTITGYTVQVLKGGVVVPTLTTTVSASSTTYTPTNLTAGGSYAFRVTATNSIGTGDAGTSDPVVPYTVPGAPLSPTAVPGSGQATVSWLPPASDGSSPITGYTVIPILNGVNQTPVVVGSAAQSTTITGLTPGGTYAFDIQATNAAGTGPLSTASPTVVINALPTLGLPVPPVGEVGVAYADPPFVPTGGTSPYAWSVIAGSLPAGITLDAGGKLSGTPTAAGTSTFTVRVTDGSGQTADQQLSLTVAAALGLTTTSLPGGQVAIDYFTQLLSSGGVGPYAWAVSSGSLPAGVTLNPSTGALSGSPTAAGTSTFTVRVTDALGVTASRSLSLVMAAQPSFTFDGVPTGEVGVAYLQSPNPNVNAVFSVTGGTAPYTWSRTSGTLPPGLTLNASTGELTGTPTTAGSYTFRIRVVDQPGGTVSRTFTVVVVPAPVATLAPPAGEVGVPYTARTTVVGGVGPFTYAVTGGTLPAGLTLDPSTGVISGTPTAATAANVTVSVQVADSADARSTAAGAFVIAPPPTLLEPAPARGDVGDAYFLQPTHEGGTGPFSYAVVAGTLPAGLTMDPATGAITGTPTAGGSSTVTIRLTDGFGVTDDDQLTIVVRTPTSIGVVASRSTVTATSPNVTFTATVSPNTVPGSVTFTATGVTGPRAGQTWVIGTYPITSATASVRTRLGAAGGFDITASFAGDNQYAGAISTPVHVEAAATAGVAVVTEYRLAGPDGPGDEYIEITNVSPIALSPEGLEVQTATGSITVPLGVPKIEPLDSYLIAGPDYSLGAVAPPDFVSPVELGSGGVKLIADDTAHTVIDQVGYAPGFSQGRPLPEFGSVPSEQYAWVRTEQNGILRNTQDNYGDFKLVSTSGSLVGGVQSTVGSPSPTSAVTPYNRSTQLTSALLDPSVAVDVAPNRVITPVGRNTPGSLVIRRVITNQTGESLTALQIRIVDISAANGLAPILVPSSSVRAELRVVDPASPTTSITVGGNPVTVQNLAVAAPTLPTPGGGLNTVLTVPLPAGGLAPGASVPIAVTFAVDAGGKFWVSWISEATTPSG